MILSDILKKINRGIVGSTSIRRFNHQNLVAKYRNRLGQQQFRNHNLESSNEANTSQADKSDEDPICRICRLTSEKSKEKLLSPCACKGTLAYIHRTCLERWLKRSGITYCELCRFTYTVKVIERYSKIYSIRKWLTDEENIDDTQDLIVDGVLTITFLPIVFICCYGFLAVYSEAPHINAYNLTSNTFEMKQKLWVIFMLGCVTLSIVASYSCWLALRSAHYHRKWTSWVRRHGNLTLILDTRKSN